MLMLSTGQLDAVRSRMEGEYCMRLATYLRRDVPDLVAHLSSAELDGNVREGVRCARSLDVTSDEGTVKFVALRIAAGPEFLTDPEIREYFELPEPDSEAKVAWLFERVVKGLHPLA